MPIYKKPEEKAVETVTIRLTLDERRMLDHLSTVDEMTLTDFIRNMIAKRAAELNIAAPPPPRPKRRPGRPKMKRPEPSSSIEPTTSTKPPPVARREEPRMSVSSTAPSSKIPPSPEAIPLQGQSPENTPPEVVPLQGQNLENESPVDAFDFGKKKTPAVFGDLAARFRESFVHRADGTKRELEESIQFLCRASEERAPIIPLQLPLCELTAERLAEVRQAVRKADARLAKKNLYLTYLRMMLHFGVKASDIDLRINPSRELPPLSIVESEERRRFFSGMTD